MTESQQKRVDKENSPDFRTTASKEKWNIDGCDFEMMFVVNAHNQSIDRLLESYVKNVRQEIDIKLPTDVDKKIKELADKFVKTCYKLEIYEKALDKLARLGNYPNYGNSIGNQIAIDALEKAKKIK